MCSRYSLSVSAVLTSRRSRRRIAPGTVRSMRSSREGAPRVEHGVLVFRARAQMPRNETSNLHENQRKADETFRRKRKNTSPVLPPNDKVSTSRPPMPLLRPSVADLCAHVSAWPVVYACMDCPGGVRHDHPQLDVDGKIPHGTRGMQASCCGSLNRPELHHSTGDQTRQKPRNDAALWRAFWAAGVGDACGVGRGLTWYTVVRPKASMGPSRTALGRRGLGHRFPRVRLRARDPRRIPQCGGVEGSPIAGVGHGHHPPPRVGVGPPLWVQRFLFIAGLTLPFDIRDVEIDRPHMTTRLWSPTDQVLRWARFARRICGAESRSVGRRT